MTRAKTAADAYTSADLDDADAELRRLVADAESRARHPFRHRREVAAQLSIVATIARSIVRQRRRTGGRGDH